jgi:hypothetical protein
MRLPGEEDESELLDDLQQGRSHEESMVML